MNVRSRQQGNALTEFFILSLVMVPALLSIPLLGKIGNVNQAAVQASRYAAWEKTIHSGSGDSGKDVETLTKEVKNRFFADTDLAVVSGAGLRGNSKNAFWAITSTGGDADSLISPVSPLTLTVENKSIPNSAVQNVSSGVVTIGNALSKAIPDSEWTLEKRGFYVATVSSEIKNPGIFSAAAGCGDSKETLSCIARHTAILVDDWSSSSSEQAENRSRSLVPATVLRPVANVVAQIGDIPLLWELKALKNAFGTVDSEQVPADRLGPWMEKQL